MPIERLAREPELHERHELMDGRKVRGVARAQVFDTSGEHPAPRVGVRAEMHAERTASQRQRFARPAHDQDLAGLAAT
jgi:hypothetical protein